MSIFNLLVVSSIWISFIGAICPALICIVYGQPVNLLHCLIAFLATWPVYASDKVSGSKEDLVNTPERAVLAHWPIKQMAIISYCLAILFVIVADWHKVPFVLSFGLAGWLYTRQIRGIRPKDIPGLKNLIVATACAACYAGLAGAGYAFMFLMILINTILFDIRDIKGDAANGVRTIPVLLGVSRTVSILAVLDCLLFVLSPEIAILGFVILWYFRIARPNLQYDFLVDGWILWSILFLVGKGYIGL